MKHLLLILILLSIYLQNTTAAINNGDVYRVTSAPVYYEHTHYLNTLYWIPNAIMNEDKAVNYKTTAKFVEGNIHSSQGILYVDSAAAPGGDGSSWEAALNSLEAALSAASEINLTEVPADSVLQIWVAKGTYTPNSGESFYMLPSVKIYGSFAGTETNLEERTFAATDTSILLGNGASVIRNNYNNLNTDAWLDGFKITGGTALYGGDNSQYGGGIYNRGSSPTFSNLVITGNSSADIGGGMLNDDGASPIICNVIFSNNSGEGRGGGGLADFTGSNAKLINVLFYHNIAITGDGGAIYNSNSNTWMVNTTISNNAAGGEGGGLYNTGSSGTPIILNAIIWGNKSAANSGHEIANSGAGSPSLSNSIYQKDAGDILGTIAVNAGNLTIDPMFVDTAHGNYRLTTFSQAIDAGNNNSIRANNLEELDHRERIFNQATGGNVDMGPYEFQGEAIHATAGILYIDSAALAGGNGGSWKTALNSLSDGLIATKAINAKKIPEDSVHQVWVAGGTYQPASGKSFYMFRRVKFYGSFSGSETDLSERNLTGPDTSILLANGTNVIDNSNNHLDTNAVLDGFKITNAPFGSSAIQNHGTSPKYSHLVIENNQGKGFKIGNHSNPLITNCVIQNNRSGIGIEYSGATITNALISNNKQCGVSTFNPENSKLTNVTITNNGSTSSSEHAGGLVFMVYHSPTIELNNCIIWGNKTKLGVNELYIVDIYNQANIHINNTVIRNEAKDIGMIGASNTFFTDTIGRDPQFIDPVNGDFHLSATSPAIDAGNNNLVPSDNILDIEDNPRIVNSVIDIGAFEYQAGTLPVELNSFSGQLEHQKLSILWKSGVELNLDHYELEKSLDAKNFRYLTTVDAKGSNSRYLYSGSQLDARAYYRIKSVDKDERSYYSAVIMLTASNDTKNSILLYPNPAKDDINIKVNSEGILSIYSTSGAKVKEQSLNKGINKIDISSLLAGVYFGVINGQKVKFIKK